MRNRTSTLLILLVLALGVFFLANRYVIARPSPADEGKRKWEYCHLYSGGYIKDENKWKAQFITSSTPAGRFDEIDSSYDGLVALNKLGSEGWEVVWVMQQNPTSPPEYILKRPKP
jgi:hypothetical protein